MSAVDKLEKIVYETRIVQNLLEYVLEDIDEGRKEIQSNFDRVASALNVIQDRLCAIDGLQQSSLRKLMEEENAPAERQLYKGAEENNSIKL